MKKMQLGDAVMESLPNDLEIYESYLIANDKLRRVESNQIMVSVSGGADSDIMLDIVSKIDPDAHFVFFDTGIEYEATKEHLKNLESKYGIEIEIEKAKTPVPTGCRKYGQPFISKQVSEWISRLQRHNFQWEDEPFEILIQKYPNCKAALRWWCNDYPKNKNGMEATYNIGYNKYLKEFMIENPPQFAISNKCCEGAKKDVAKDYKKKNNIKLSLVGVRKAEGGARARIPNCFTENCGNSGVDEYRPLFWYKKANKELYDKHFDIQHSRCYSEYGLKRTGCAGCPFGRDFEFELEVIKKYEPKLYKAINKIFGDSYEYTRKYKEFVKNARFLSKEVKK